MAQSLLGKIAIGSGSSSGIGAAIALELARRGAHVVVNYPFPSLCAEGEAVVAELPTQGIAVCADLSTIRGPSILIDAAVKEFGRIDILVNNAALAIAAPFEKQTMNHWDAMVNLNGRGVFLLTQHALPHLSEGSRIVNICSAASRGAPPHQTVYAGTKGMIDSFTQVWAKELPRKYKCTVNSIAPGPIATPAIMNAPPEELELIEPVINMTPVAPRMGEPEDIAYGVAILCEGQAKWMNGVHLHINGGLLVC
ncbi:hypothetical protein BJY00DRAFT_304323 [Aspergillus carlsbadensis]|nr:hypothetical protein BJY00DRAFT_304323 [Aspergillus carlsbadensis]